MRVPNKRVVFIRQHGDQNNQNDLELEKRCHQREKRNKINGTSPANLSSQWTNSKKVRKAN